jgi:hypothetical protein
MTYNLTDVIAVGGAICSAVVFTFGMKAILSCIVIELTHEPMTAPKASRQVSLLILKAMLFFSIAFVLIMTTHN